jgi:hypothetical protein
MTKQPSKVDRNKTVVHSSEMLNYASYAVDHLWDMVSVLKYHTHAQRDAIGTDHQASAKESQALAKTMLNLYKQIDRYMAILHPPTLLEESEPEAFNEQNFEDQEHASDHYLSMDEENDVPHLKQDSSNFRYDPSREEKFETKNLINSNFIENTGIPSELEPDFKRRFA